MRHVGATGYIYFGSYVYRFQFVRHFLIAGLHIVPPVSPHYQIDCWPSENAVATYRHSIRVEFTVEKDAEARFRFA